MSDRIGARHSDLWEFPLPAPGLVTRAIGSSVISGNYKTMVEIASPPTHSVALPDLPPIPCTIEILDAARGSPRLLARSTLRHAGSYGYDQLYASNEFFLPKGEFDLRVRNAGSTSNYVFQGGTAHLLHPQPVTIGFDQLFWALGYLFAAIGLLPLFLTLMPTDPAEPGSPSEGA